MKLNDNQIKAIKHDTGPLLIIAGAGTGKTTVVTERIKYLIQSKKAKPEEILALTFTEKAAFEMEKRVDQIMPLSYGNTWIMTFHSFCDQILRQDGLHIGLPSNFKLMTREKSFDFFKRNLFNFSLNYFRPLGNPNKFIESLLTHFSRLQDEAVTPNEYLSWIKTLKKTKTKTQKVEESEKLEIEKWEELATVYKEYDQLKLKEAKFDFGDLIIKTIKLFKDRPNILEKYQQRFNYILVDEFQDTNFAQNELVNLIAQKHKNIAVIGDDNQSIYKFRGAAISNILKFKEKYKNAQIITLNQNYRSTQKILDGAYKLIKHNDPDTLECRMKISKKLKGVNNQFSPDIGFIYKQTQNEEAEEVAKTIIQLIDEEKRYEYRDFSILVRANNHAHPFVREFERQGIPHQFLGPSSLFRKEEVIDLISYLKSLYDTEDTESFYRLLSSDNLNIKHSELLRLLSKSKKESKSLYEIFTKSNLNRDLLDLFTKHLDEMKSKNCGEILYEYVSKMGIYKKVIENEEDIKARNISKFFEKIRSFEDENPKAKLREVVDYINLLEEIGESPEVANDSWQEENKVNILTVHSSKGLEFPVVFMVNLVSDRFPTKNRGDDLPIPDELIKEELPTGDFHIQEERRLFYVGMTRAKERLYLTAAKYYSEGVREKKISQFVIESLDESVIRQQLVANDKKRVLNNVRKTIHSALPITRDPLQIDYLSVSQIETFKTCPMHYKLKYIYKLPTPKTASISFGISIHETLKQIYERLKEKGTIDEKIILELYKNNFINEGFDNKKHKQQFYEKGESYLISYFKNEFNTKIIPEELEKKFTLNLFKDLRIGGTIDRLDKISENEMEVIDYKTGADIPTQKEVDKDLQLSIYAIAVSEIYGLKPEQIKLSLYYLDTQEKISTVRTVEKLEAVKKEIYSYKLEIEKSDFKCNNSYFCQRGCEFSMFCNKEI